jgi:hypothetical protein
MQARVDDAIAAKFASTLHAAEVGGCTSCIQLTPIA